MAGRSQMSMPLERLEARAHTVHVGFQDATLAPAIEIEDGQEIWVETVSADPSHDVPRDWLPAQIEALLREAETGTGPHILTGPIAVRGAKPGDVLEVEIREIRLTQPYGYNIVSPLKGMFAGEEPAQRTHIIPIDMESGAAEIAPGLRVPTRPFFGQMGVAPPPAWGRVDSRPPSRYGGNIDNKELLPGVRLFLPVANEGALFSVGDGHAAQGDGEVNQTAIETSLDGRLRLSVRRDIEVDWPIAVTPTHLMTMAFHEDLDDAARLAMRSMIRLLVEHYRLSFHEAYRLCSVAADMRVTQFVNGNRGIHVMLARAPLEGLAAQPAFLARRPDR
jgi:acetamidase/formamidase